jgi:hypothetical protein
MDNLTLRSIVVNSGKIASRNADEIILYGIFAVIVTICARMLSDLLFSALVTFSAAFTALGFALLLKQVQRRKGVLSVSLRSLYLYAIALGCRLYSTLQYNGYLPVDRSGDWLYQLIETAALVCAVVLIIKVKKLHDESCLVGVDTCNAAVLFVACFLIAIAVHPRLNNSTIPDVLWTLALYVETVAMVPQLFLLTKLGGEVDSLQGHYIACMFMARLAMMRFWVTCYEELRPKHAEYNLPGLGVIGSQLLQVVLFADFMHLYFKSLRTNAKLILPVTYSI